MPCLSVSDSASAPDTSSASRPVFRAASHYGPVFRLPSHSIPWLLGLPPPFRDIPQCLARSAWHSPWHPLHHYVFRCTAAHSGHTTSLPPLCRICISRCSALLTRRIMSRDVVPLTRYHFWPAIVLDLLSTCTTLACYVALYLTHSY